MFAAQPTKLGENAVTEVVFLANGLREVDAALAATIEEEVRGAVAALDDPRPVACRIFVNEGLQQPQSIRIQLERPGWVSTFALPTSTAANETRQAVFEALNRR
jgi:hypothetical protein